MSKIQSYFLGLIWLPLSGPIQSSDPVVIWTQGLMSPSLRWNILLRGSFGLTCANLAPGEVELDFSAHEVDNKASRLVSE